MTVKLARSTAHGDKLRALLNNPSLPAVDRPRVEAAMGSYREWVSALDRVEGAPEEIIENLTFLLNEYKRKIELELIFDSPENFLYRQKGQIKLDNSILEEFLPRLFDDRLVPGLRRIESLACGPHSSFAGISFDAPFLPLGAGGVQVKLKDQDFAICRPFVLTVADPQNPKDTFTARLAVSYFAMEIKTNLDKTMFQEASQTAGELKRAVPGAKVLLLCEFLDMTPISTRLTPIDEVIVMRKAKRLASNIRANFSTSAGRVASRAAYAKFLADHPTDEACVRRIVEHIKECFPELEPGENVVLTRGYF